MCTRLLFLREMITEFFFKKKMTWESEIREEWGGKKHIPKMFYYITDQTRQCSTVACGFGFVGLFVMYGFMRG